MESGNVIVVTFTSLCIIAQVKGNIARPVLYLDRAHKKVRRVTVQVKKIILCIIFIGSVVSIERVMAQVQQAGSSIYTSGTISYSSTHVSSGTLTLSASATEPTPAPASIAMSGSGTGNQYGYVLYYYETIPTTVTALFSSNWQTWTCTFAFLGTLTSNNTVEVTVQGSTNTAKCIVESNNNVTPVLRVEIP